MIGAALYIIRCSAQNRLRSRLRRLRQPRYLIGAIVGVAYLYLTIFARRRPPRRRAGRAQAESAAILSSIAAGAPPVVATGLLAVAALAWLVPVDTGLVTFTDPEVDFLFTAPLTRRQVVLYRLVRGQLPLLIGAIIAVLVYPGITAMTRLRTSLALWVALITIRVYATAVMQARRGFSANAPALNRAAWLPLAVVAGAVAVVGAALARAFAAAPADNLVTALQTVRHVATTGIAASVLWAPAALVRPFFAPDWPTYLAAMAPALLVLAAVTAWLIRTDELFYELDTDAAGKEAGRPKPVTVRARTVPWRLAPSGRPELAFAWRAALEMIRGTGVGGSLRPLAAVVPIVVMAVAASRQRGIAQVLELFALVAAGMAALLGPQMLRIDLRQDLRNIDLLKTWPIRPADLIRGEIVWPAAILSLGVWLALAVALTVSGAAFGRYPLLVRMSIAASAAIVAPMLIAAQFAIHNAAALAFPAWISTGSQRPRGLDAMGQRLILLAATMLLLAFASAPAGAAGAAVWFALRAFAGPYALIPSAIVAAAILAVEVLVATESMAPLYDSVDLSEIERAET